MSAKKKCPVCGSGTIRHSHPRSYEYDHCGLTGVVLEGGGVTIAECDACAHRTTTIESELQLQQVIGMAIVTGERGLTGERLRYLRNLFEMTQAELATLLGIPRRPTIADWEAKGLATICDSVVDEIGIRAVLMRAYCEKVIEADHCQLTRAHLEAFKGEIGNFVEHTRRLLDAERNEGKVSIKKRSGSGDWSIDAEAA